MLLLSAKACIWNSEAKVYFDIFCFFLSPLHIILDPLQEILFYCTGLPGCWHATNISQRSSQRSLHRCLQADTNIPVSCAQIQKCHCCKFVTHLASCEPQFLLVFLFYCLFVCLEWDERNKITLTFFTLLVTMAQCAVRNREAVGSC